MCLTESLRLFVLYVVLFRIHGHSCDHATCLLSFDLFPCDKQSKIKATYIGRRAIYDECHHLLSTFSVDLYCTFVTKTIKS